MNTRNLMKQAALALGISLAGASLAQVAPPSDPSAMTPGQREAWRTQRQAEMSAMTPGQRAAAQAGRGQGGRQQGQGTMARDGSGSGGRHGKGGGQGGGGMRAGR